MRLIQTVKATNIVGRGKTTKNRDKFEYKDFVSFIVFRINITINCFIRPMFLFHKYALILVLYEKFNLRSFFSQRKPIFMAIKVDLSYFQIMVLK